MKNRNLFLLTSGLAFPLLGAYAQKTPKPNIIYIMCDDMGYGDLGCYGQSYISTPNIDNMAKEGISNAKAKISELNAPSIPTTGTTVGEAIKTLSMESTAYYGHGITASGLKPVRNPDGISTIAVDPNVIPLGSKVYVSGYGLAIAADTGGAIKGNIIDVYLNSYEECMSWGRRQVTVQILE